MNVKKQSPVNISCFFCLLAAVMFLFACSDGEKHAAASPEVHAGSADGHDDNDHGAEDDDTHAAAQDEHPEHTDEQDGHAHGPVDSAAGDGPAAVQAEASDDHEDEVEVTPEALKLAGITLAKAGIGRISTSVKLSGEVGFNEDRLVRITPRFSGILQEARFRKGECVKAGEVVAVIDSNESMSAYSLKAPLSGRIIEKQAVPGEYVSEDQSIYVLADLSTVWVNLAVYPKDADKVKPGRKLSIAAVGTDTRTEGAVSYVTPVIDAQTRTITAVVVLPNDDNAWRPGSFVHAHMEDGEGAEGLVVDKNAVQILDNKSVVFIQHEPGSFKPLEVVTGEHDDHTVLIVSGLKAGDEYVNNGAFELKAKIVTSSLGDHAGHGH